MPPLRHFRVELDRDGVACVFIDVIDSRLNALSGEAQDELGVLVQWLAENREVAGILIASKKNSAFSAGGDLTRLQKLARMAQRRSDLHDWAYQIPARLNRPFRTLETCGKPVAAAIAGVAVGGGLELAMACHYRVCAEDAAVRLGLPEANVGLMPGAGGTQRLPRLVGVKPAISMMLSGALIGVEEASRIGLIDALAPAHDVVERAKDWLRGAVTAQQPWDCANFRVPAAEPFVEMLEQAIEQHGAETRGWSDPGGRENLLRAVLLGMLAPFDTGVRIEERFFVQTMLARHTAGNIRTNFDSVRALKGGPAWPTDAFGARVRAAAHQEMTSLASEGVTADIQARALKNAGFRFDAGECAESVPRAHADRIRDRVLCAMTLEVLRCMDDGVVTDPRAADVGAIHGAGFPDWAGGPLSMIDSIGWEAWRLRCELADKSCVLPPGIETMRAAAELFYPAADDGSEVSP